MKRSNFAYMTAWRGGAAVVLVIAFLILWTSHTQVVTLVCAFCILAVAFAVPFLMERIMEKKADALAADFPYQMRFKTSSSVFFFDPAGGRAAVVWKHNPFELQLLDLTKVSNIRTVDGKQFRGTSQVSCQFDLEGKRIKICTLRVSRGQLAMNDRRVLEAISKADRLCEILAAAKQAG